MRLALTVLAIAMSVSLVVAVTSGYASAEAAFFKYFAEYVGATDLEISKSSEHDAGQIDQAVYDALARDPDVRTISGRLEQRTSLRNSAGLPFSLKEWTPPLVIGVNIAADADIATLKMEPDTTGRWFKPDEPDAIVIDQEAAKSYNLDIGSELTLVTTTQSHKLKLVGVVHKPAIVALFDRTAYVPLTTLQKVTGATGKVTSIRITLRTGMDIDVFLARWKPLLAKLDPFLHLSTTREARKQVDKQMQGVEFLSYMGGAVSMVAATFIVFSTLSMGVSERQRALAMLRAVGMFRSQIVLLVMAEGVLLAVMGAGLGVPLGLLWTWILTTWKAHVFVAGMVPNVGGMLFATIGSVTTSLAAGILPALAASRVSPVEAMTAVGEQPRNTMPLWAALAGLVLISIDTAIIYNSHSSRELVFYGHFFLGIPCLLVGFFLLAPSFVWSVEKALGYLVATLLCVRYSLLRQQLSRSIWRAAGTAASLMVGLAVLVVMHTHGKTLIGGWEIPDRFPDIFIFAQPPSSFTKDQIAKLDNIEGVKAGDVLPIGITNPKLPSGFLSLAMAAVMPDTTMFLAVDPDKAFRMMDLKFLEGNAAEASKKLNSGRYIVVTDEFRQIRGMHVGSKLKLSTGLLVRQDFEYEIAGVIWSPGIDVFVSIFDTGRQYKERSVATVFGSLKNGEKDFGINTYTLFAANLTGGVDKKVLEGRMKEKLGSMGLRMGDVRQIKAGIEKGFERLLELVSSVALAAILVASLGVMNTVMASVRSRRWHLGVLRSLGLTRGELLRLIVAEALLLGLVAAVLGVVAGLLMSYNANGLSWRIVGYHPPIRIAWGAVWKGVAIILGVALASSLIPAIKAAKEEPLSLLQTGRAG